MTVKKILLFFIRFLIGGMFITTAVLKLISLDEFELYIYSFNICSFILSTVLARLLIAFEFLLGVFLLLKIYYKKTWWLTLFTMIGFTLFLVYVALFRNDSNCHCFGNLVELNPIHSIFKNVITIVLLLFIQKENDHLLPKRKWIIGIVFAVSLIVPFVVFPMDTLYQKFVSEDRSINTMALEQAKTDSIFCARIMIHEDKSTDSITFSIDSSLFHIDSGSFLMCYVSSSCHFCKLGLKKIHLITQQNNIHPSKIKVMVFGDSQSIIDFIKETESFKNDFYWISPMVAIDITFGIFPTFVWMQHGAIIQSGDFRSINEKELVNFLQ